MFADSLVLFERVNEMESTICHFLLACVHREVEWVEFPRNSPRMQARGL